MKRLTERNKFEHADIIGIKRKDLLCSLGLDKFKILTTAIKKLTQYEGIGED